MIENVVTIYLKHHDAGGYRDLRAVVYAALTKQLAGKNAAEKKRHLLMLSVLRFLIDIPVGDHFYLVIDQEQATADDIGKWVRWLHGRQALGAFGEGRKGEALFGRVVDEFKAADVATVDYADARLFVPVALMANLKATGGARPRGRHGWRNSHATPDLRHNQRKIRDGTKSDRNVSNRCILEHGFANRIITSANVFCGVGDARGATFALRVRFRLSGRRLRVS